jgi:MATE family multidrug resistance protein
LRRAYDTAATFRIEWALMLRLLRFGLPAAMHLLLDVGSFTLFLLLTARLGAKELAASNIAFSINNLAFMPLIGIGTAAAILVGQYQGRGQSDVAERAGWTALKVGWIYMGAIALTFVLVPRGYFLLFTGHAGGAVQLDDVLPIGRWMLVMMAVWGLADAANIILSSALRGAGDTRFVMLFSFVAGWVLWLGGEALLLLVFDGGMLAAWVWLVVYVFILVAGFYWRYRSGRWKAIDLLGHRSPS